MAIVCKIGSRISTSSAANPTTITTATPHGLTTGDEVVITGHSLSGVNGTRTVTVTGAATFTVSVLGGGTGGRYQIARNLLISGIGGGWSVNGRNTLTGEIVSLNGAYRPEMDDTVELWEGVTQLFSGVITKAIEKGLGGSPVAHITTRIECADYWVFTERLLVTYALPAGGNLLQTLTALINVTGITAAYGIALHPSQATGPTIPETRWTFKYLNEVLEELTTLSGGWIGSIDENKYLRFIKPDLLGGATTPYNAVDDDGNVIGDVEVELDRDTYANRVWVRCGESALEETTHGVNAVFPVGSDIGGGLWAIETDRVALTYTEQPGAIIVNGVSKTIFAPGVRDNGNLPEWYWDWVGGTGATAYVRVPRVIHNDGVYGAISNGTPLYLESKGPEYYNTVYDILYGPVYTADANYRWYTSKSLYALEQPLPVHTFWLNNTTPVAVGAEVMNEVTGAPWDWVWDDTNKRLGHRLAATPLGFNDQIFIYTLAPFELIVQSPDPATEPTAEQTARGLTEILIDAPEVYNEDQGVALADQYLTIRLIRPKRVRYRTNTAGKILPGQVQTIQLAKRNLNGEFFITEVTLEPSGEDTFLSRRIAAVDSDTYTGSWRDTYLQWGGTKSGSGSSSGTSAATIPGGGGGIVSGGISVYLLATGVEAQQSGTPDWVAASNIVARINTVARGSVNATVFCRLRGVVAGVTVQARLYNVTDSEVVATSSVVNSTSWQTVPFNVVLAAGIKDYRLELLPSVASLPVQGMAYLE